MPKLSKQDWVNIKSAYENGHKASSIAKDYGISHSNINRIEKWAKIERRTISQQIVHILEDFTYRNNL